MTEKPPRRKSNVWFFYDKVDENSGRVLRCRLCGHIMKSCGNTTNMQKHVQTKHPTEWDHCLEVVKQKGGDAAVFPGCKASTPKPDPKANRPRSNVWQLYEKVKDHPDGGPHIRCRLCGRISRACGNTTNMQKHLQSQHPTEWKTCQEGGRVELGEEEAGRTETTECVVSLQKLMLVKEGEEPVETVEVQSAGTTEEPQSYMLFAYSENGEAVPIQTITAEQASAAAVPPAEAPSPQKKTQAKRGRKRKAKPTSDSESDDELPTPKLTFPKREAPPKPVPRTDPKDDLCDSFARYVASILRNLPTGKACELQNQIVKLLLDSMRSA